jgi:hypothetical protein
MKEYMTALETLYARFEAIAEGRVAGGNSAAAHQAVLARLSGNELMARREGWTGLILRRLGGTGRVYLEGARPDGGDRSVVPDWLGAPAPDRYEQTGRGRRPQ